MLISHCAGQVPSNDVRWLAIAVHKVLACLSSQLGHYAMQHLYACKNFLRLLELEFELQLHHVIGDTILISSRVQFRLGSWLFWVNLGVLCLDFYDQAILKHIFLSLIKLIVILSCHKFSWCPVSIFGGSQYGTCSAHITYLVGCIGLRVVLLTNII